MLLCKSPSHGQELRHRAGEEIYWSQAVRMEKSEINTVQRRSSSHIQSHYTIISVTANEARLETEEGEEGKRIRGTKKRRKDAKEGVWE